jgi:ComF family protein
MPHGLLQLEWCATYSGVPRAALHALKYGGERRLAEPIAEALAARWSRAGAGGDLVTWVPVHPSRRRDRGYDQAELLARAMARRLGLPAAACLERQQRTTAQHTLGRRDRAGNLRGAFVVPGHQSPRVAGRWVVVVDDILTTGATLAGCAEALRAARVMGVSAITVARDR